MLRWVTLLALAAALAAPAAIAATATDVAAYVSHRSPTDVQCSPAAEWQTLTASAGVSPSASGLTWPIAGRVRFAPWVCAALDAGTASPQLGAALNIVAHESAHLLGVRDESVAACWGLVWSYELAWKFYNVPYFTAESWRIGQSALAVHRTLPADYHRVCG